jgi:hypothetical protein
MMKGQQNVKFGKLPLWGIDLIAELRFGFTSSCLFFAERPGTLSQQSSSHQHDYLAATMS